MKILSDNYKEILEKELGSHVEIRTTHNYCTLIEIDYKQIIILDNKSFKPIEIRFEGSIDFLKNIIYIIKTTLTADYIIDK